MGCNNPVKYKTPTQKPVVINTPEPTEVIEEDPVVILINQLGSKNYDLINSAEKKLLKYGPDAFTVLLKELEENEDPNIRASCVRILKNDETFIDSISEAIEDEDENVRYEIVRAFCKFKDETTLDSLIKILNNDPSPRVRAEAAYTLGWIGNKKALYPLFENLKDENELVREWAVYGLGLLKEPESIKTLSVMLKEDPEAQALLKECLVINLWLIWLCCQRKDLLKVYCLSHQVPKDLYY